MLKRGLVLTGQVLDGQGNGLAGVKLTTGRINFYGESCVGYSRADGKFTIEGLGEGERSVHATKSGFFGTRATVMVSDNTEPMTIRIQRGGTITGRVVNASGKPIPGASVYGRMRREDRSIIAAGKRCSCDLDGQFELRELPPAGIVTVHVWQRDHLAGSAPGTAIGKTGVEIRLERGGSIAGRVVDARTQQPIDEFKLKVGDSRDEVAGTWGVPMTIRGTNGHFESRRKNYELGHPLHVRVEAAGYAPQYASARCTVDPPAGDMLIMLHESQRIVGVVRDRKTGKPISRATIRMFDASIRDLSGVVRPNAPGFSSDAKGRFEITSVEPGSSKLVVLHPDYVDEIHGPFEVGSGPGDIELSIAMGQGATVRGRIEGFDGLDLRVRMMSYDGLDNRQIKTLGTVDREFTFERVSNGRHLIAAGSGKRQYLRAEFVIVDDDDIHDFVLREQEGDCSVKVRVRGITDGSARVRPKQGTAGAIRMFEFENGAFTVTGLAPGTHRVHVESGPRSAEREVELSPGIQQELAIDVR